MAAIFAVNARLAVNPQLLLLQREGRLQNPSAVLSKYPPTSLHLGCKRGSKSGSSNRALRSMEVRWDDWRRTATPLARAISGHAPGSRVRPKFLVVMGDIAGQYDENFEDIQKNMLDYFTFKAVKTVLGQLSEMNPPTYAWFYDFVVKNKPQDSKLFIRSLVKENQELAERVMVTRLHLFNKWVKRYNHEELYIAIKGQNLELLRERLIQTVSFQEIDRPPPTAPTDQ